MKTDLIPRHGQAVGLYVHIPFCQSKCRYCSFYSKPLSGSDPADLVRALIAELDRYKEVETVQTVYLGGGSPTALPPDLLAQVLQAIISIWPAPREFTVECNPGQTDARTLSMLAGYGVNRLSFGVQSFDDGELALLGRRHSVKEAVQSIRRARELGFDNLGLDLIFAIPGSSLDTWKRSLGSALDLGVQHISTYSLSFERGTAFHEAREAGELTPVDEDTDRRMYETAIDTLTAGGLVHYEISNFARDGFQCLHNQGYWANRPYIGIGPSAGSYWSGKRMVNVSDIDRYIRRIEKNQPGYRRHEQPDAAERICETAVLNLRTRRGIDLVEFQMRTGADFKQIFSAPLKRYEQQGLIEVTADCVRLSREALAVADPILCDFSAF